MKRTLCILLSLLLAVTGFAGLCVPAAAADWQTGDVVTLGSYPQSRVTDDATIAALNAVVKTWVSYGCYSGTGSISDGRMSAKDYMQYCDVTVDGQKYRGVQFTQYRPKITGYGAWADNSYQDDNGYTANTVYWFRYEPLNWRVLDPTTGLVLCETVIDSQPVNNYALSDAGKYYGDADKTHYANNYAESSVRAWLNDAFYATAFTALQQNAITETTLDNSAYSTGFSGFDSASTTDKVFLLSYREAQNTAYGFSGNINANDAARQAEGTDYAKCQGVNVAPGGTSPWWLRSAGYTSAAVCSVHAAGPLYYNYNAYYTYYGIRPAMTVDPDALVVPYQNGDIIEFGFYLQGKLVNEDSIAALEAAAPYFSQWTSYDYYIGTGNEADGQMIASDYMRWCEITLDGKQYRGVRFMQYRPWKTDAKSTKSASAQDNHGYVTDTTYWFRYRPLQWRVIDAEKGILLCETIIDSQPINSYVIQSGTDDYGETAYWGDAAQSRYANDYARSDLRQWLNGVFLNMAFSPQEQAVLTFTTLDNSADGNVSRPAYGSAATTDRVFLLSYADAQNAAYGFTDNASRRAKSSGYAKCQGADVTSDYSHWLLRSPGNSSRDVILVNYKGEIITTNYAYTTDVGVRPAVSADLRALYALQNIHAYGEPVWDWADDYSSATATFTCTVCGNEQTATDNYIDETVVSTANCTHGLVKKYTASVTLDGTEYSDTTDEVTVPGTTTFHILSDWTEPVPATCGSAGSVGYYTCKTCGTHIGGIDTGFKTLSDDEIVIPATGNHTFAWITDTEPTCGADGVKHEECTVCHATQNENTPIPATGNHTWEWITDTEPTCGADGVKHEECTVCHAVQNENTPIPATGNHTWEWITDTEPTCGADGVKHEECTVCHATQNENTPIPATGNHTFAWVTDTEPTCGADGVKHEECTVCHATQNENTPIPATGNHDWKNEWSKDADMHWHDCTRCDEKNDEAAHSYGEVTYTWEQTRGAWKATAKRACTVCEWEESETVTATSAQTKAPTCTVNGETTYTAAFGKPAFETQTKTVDDISALDHAYDAVVTPPTCTEDGYTTHTCSRCGDTYVDGETDALGHAFGEWEIIRTATPNETGEKKRTCLRCGEVETAQIEALTITSSFDGQSGSALTVTVPYAKRGAIATQLSAEEPVTYTSSNPKLLTVDEDGSVQFSRLCIFCKSATITAVSADGSKAATCKVNVEVKWWQYIIWLLLGSLWF